MKDIVNAFPFIWDNASLLWEKALDQLAISAIAMAISLAIAIPLGVWLGHLHRASFLAINVSNVGRALPSLAVISIGIAYLGIGFWNVLVALVVLAAPVMLANAYVAVEQVDRNAVEAARAAGMTAWQVLTRIELRLATPLIFAGIRTGSVYVIATATLATFAGGGGLGDIIVNESTYGVPGVIAGSLAIIALAFAVDGLLAVVQRAATPRPLRKSGRLGRADAIVTAAPATEDLVVQQS